MKQTPFDDLSFSRTDRVASQIQRELAVLIREKLKDPRVGRLISLQEVQVSKDLAHAKVWFDLLGDQNGKEIEAVLQNAASFLRRQLGRQVKLREVPQLKFIYDDTYARGDAISSLIDQALASDQQNKDV